MDNSDHIVQTYLLMKKKNKFPKNHRHIIMAGGIPLE